MSSFVLRPSRSDDQAGMYYVCLKTGDFGQDGEPFYPDDPDALGRIFVGPYLRFELGYALTLEDADGICGYALGALDSRQFYARYDQEWRPDLCNRFPLASGEPNLWTRAQKVHGWYHQPDYFCPEPYAEYPSHLHIDLLPRAQGLGYGRRMMAQVMKGLHRDGSPGVHLGVSMMNPNGHAFYRHLGFMDLARVGQGAEGCIYMGKRLVD